MTEEASDKESHMRSVLKALSWRIVATVATFAIAYIVTHDPATAGKIAAVEVIAKLVIYYLHERAWQSVPLGSVRKIFRK